MYYDIHCHADKLSSKEIETAIKENFIIGAVGMNLESNEKILRLKERYPKNIKVFLGIHPESQSYFHEIDRVIELIEGNLDKISGIGEIGIPFFYLEGKSAVEKKKIKYLGLEIFERFLKTASKFKLPVNLHVVGSDIHLALPLLKRYNIEGALFHWYEGSLEDLNLLVLNNHFISISPDILVNKEYFEFAKKIPLDMVLLESDGPWEYDGKRGTPQMIFNSASILAPFHNLTTTELLLKISENTYRYLDQNKN
jgi:TatD DNase family protein